MDLRMSVRINSEHNYLNSALIYDMKNYVDLEKRLYPLLNSLNHIQSQSIILDIL